MITDQEVFNKAATHLIRQGVRAVVKGVMGATTCRYRVPYSDLRCAIGVLIPDSLYNPCLEGIRVGLLVEGHPEMRPYIGNNARLLYDLQFTHDSALIKPSMWPDQLREIANKYKLSVPQAVKDALEQTQDSYKQRQGYSSAIGANVDISA